MSGTGKSSRSQVVEHCLSVRPKRFIFCDRKTGIPCIEVNAGKDGSLPSEQAAGLVAMHCISHNQTPADFIVTVSVGENLMSGLISRANKLLRSYPEDGPRIHLKRGAGARLSRRQGDVLILLGENLTNKEIAQKLHICERTAKFHVSSLLRKFGVSKRMDLVLEVDRQRRNTLATVTTQRPAAVGDVSEPSTHSFTRSANASAGHANHAELALAARS
jgi:DNA-binding CsgD family transcriptional regulator